MERAREHERGFLIFFRKIKKERNKSNELLLLLVSSHCLGKEGEILEENNDVIDRKIEKPATGGN